MRLAPSLALSFAVTKPPISDHLPNPGSNPLVINNNFRSLPSNPKMMQSTAISILSWVLYSFITLISYKNFDVGFDIVYGLSSGTFELRVIKSIFYLRNSFLPKLNIKSYYEQ